MIFKNIIDTKLHKIEMKLYRAFEVMFFNSRDDLLNMEEMKKTEVEKEGTIV